MKPHAAVLAVALTIVVAMAAAAAAAGAADPAGEAVPAGATSAAADSVAAAAPAPLAAREFRVAAPVSPTLATVMSPVFPGWGQLYADNGWRGVLAFGAEMFYWSRLLMYDRKAERLLDWRDATDNTAVQDFYWAQAEE